MSVSQRSCSHHEGVPAIAVCTRCGEDICGSCHGVDVRGLAVCAECRRQAAPPAIPWESDRPGATVGGFFKTVFAALTNPRGFFGRIRPDVDSWSMAAVFGIICIALGTLLDTLWQKAFSADYGQTLQTYHEEVGLSLELVEILQFASIPVGAILLYFIHTALVYLALKTFSVSRATWTMVARITGYALASYLLLVFPPVGEFPLGQFLMILWLFNLEVSAVRSLFSLGFWKSIGVILPPFIVFLLVIG